MQRYRCAYGYTLSACELLWPHLLGRSRREVDAKAFSCIELTRVGSEIEAGKSRLLDSGSPALA